MRLQIYHYLGFHYFEHGELAEAEAGFQGASGGAKIAFGLDHELTPNAMNALGMIYVRQEKVAKAEAV